MINKEKLIELLRDQPNKADVETFAAYIKKISMDLANRYMTDRTEEEIAILFRRVSEEGLVFDGKHITLQSNGISYDYQAYKNKMILAYPESTIDLSLVYKGDEFSVSKESGSVMYHHNIGNPLEQKTEDITGGYCVIKNKRGEFLTLLSREDIDKHRKVAKTDMIWSKWPKEMALKTIIKKACKQHFSDIYEKIDEMDNGNYELENPLDLSLEYKQAIDAIDTLEALAAYYEANKGQGAAFDKYVSIRKDQLTQT